MEESKDLFYHTQSIKLLLDKNHKTVNFSGNNITTQFFPKSFNSRNINENYINKTTNNDNITYNSINNNKLDNNIDKDNKKIYASPKANKKLVFPISSLKKPSFLTPNSFSKKFKTNLKKPFLNINRSRNDKISSNINTLSNLTFKNNKLYLERTKFGSRTDQRPSALTIKNKRIPKYRLYSKIKFINNKKFLEKNKFQNLFKSDEEEKSIKTYLLTDRYNRDKDVIQLKNKYRRHSIATKNNNMSILNYISNNNFNSKRDRKSSCLLIKNKSKNQSKNVVPIIVNPLLIAEEDKIFDEMKQFLCFKYEQKKLKKKSIEAQKKLDKMKANSPKLKIIKNKIQTDDQIKLDYLYLSTTKINRKIKYIKRKKDRQNLVEYQNNLLDVIKPSVSDYTYTNLKDRLIDIRLKNNKKYQNNYKKIRDIENIEQNLINNFNNICQKCLKTFKRVRAEKQILHSNNLKLKLPLLSFISCLKKKKTHKKKNNY